MATMPPTLHLSLPVDDLTVSRKFYVDWLNCVSGRQNPGWMDVWFFGMQITLHHEPEQTLSVDKAGVRHFGVTLPIDELRSLVATLDPHPINWLHTLHIEFEGTPREQHKAKLADPSGNVIELKAYKDPTTALQPPV